VTAPTGYWPGVARVLALVDPDAPERYRVRAIAAATATDRAWPYSVQTAADVVLVTAAR
jgi:hypothetical protein